MEALSAVRHSLAALRSPNLSLLTLNFWHDDSWITRDKGQGRFPRSLWIMKACHLPLIYFFLPQLDRVCHGCERQHLQTTRDIWASLLFANLMSHLLFLCVSSTARTSLIHSCIGLNIFLERILTQVSVYTPGWPRSCDPLALASLVFGLQAKATMPRRASIFFNGFSAARLTLPQISTLHSRHQYHF